MQDFSSDSFSGLNLTGQKFVSCNFNRAISDETTVWYGVEFHACTMIYTNFSKSKFERCSFIHCDAGFLDARDSIFEHCSAVWTNFGGSSFKNATVKSLMTNNCDFFTSRIQNAFSINPYSRDMISEILRIKAKDDFRKLEVAAFIKNSPDLCWRDFAVLADTPNYRPIANDILDALKEMGVVSERNMERYKTHDEEV